MNQTPDDPNEFPRLEHLPPPRPRPGNQPLAGSPGPGQPPTGTTPPMGTGATIVTITAFILIVGGIIAAIGWGAWWVWTNAGDDTTPDGTVDRLAEYACEDAVKSVLKAPSTAKFHHGTVNGSRDDELLVVGRVDSENSFGASIRSTYTCSVEWSDTDNKVTKATVINFN